MLGLLMQDDVGLNLVNKKSSRYNLQIERLHTSKVQRIMHYSLRRMIYRLRLPTRGIHVAQSTPLYQTIEASSAIKSLSKLIWHYTRTSENDDCTMV